MHKQNILIKHPNYMQTFLPYPDFVESSLTLDKVRLNKQVIEGFQILKSMAGMYPTNAWINHPATRMWKGHAPRLIDYSLIMAAEAERRGITYKPTELKDNEKGFPYLEEGMTLPEKIAMMKFHPSFIDQTAVEPEWLGREDFHASHRSNLLRKEFEYYSQFEWTEPIDLPYVWPK